MLNLQRGIVPVCLTFSLLHFALPALADTPAKTVAQASTAQTIVLQHIIPGDIVKMMHWEQPSNLPTGVTQIVSVPLQNALLVTATPAGLAQVSEIVKLVDIAPRQVQIKLAVASVSGADLTASRIGLDLSSITVPRLKQKFPQYVSGSEAASFLQTLTTKRAVTEEPDMTTTNNVQGSATLSTTALPAAFQQIRVTPYINADNSVALDLHVTFFDGAGKQAVNTFWSIRSGEPLLLIMPPASAGDKNLLLFVTPTIK